MVSRWTCPNCQREFGRPNQWHSCRPSSSVDEYFASRPPVQRAIYEAIVRQFEGIGPVLVDPVNVGVVIKRSRSFAVVRAKRDRLVLEFLLSRAAEHPRISRTMRLSANRTAHAVDLTRVEDVDDQVRDWLTEAYQSSPI